LPLDYTNNWSLCGCWLVDWVGV